MGSKRFDGVRFRCYPDDHPPAHVHGFYAEVQVIVELHADGTVIVANRKDAIKPRNASRSDMRQILRVAAAHSTELISLWEETHGKAN